MRKKRFTAAAVISAMLAIAAQAAESGVACEKGKPVSVLYGGQWYPAKVLDGPDRNGACLVSYDGYGANWDEWVAGRRMRPANAAAGQPARSDTEPAPQSAGVKSIPAGKYGCYTFDNGQLNYTYTDVVIEKGSRYSVGGKGGTYTLGADGAMRFTGAMANATGKFSVKNSGKPQIDLVFNGDARASMACSRSR